MADSEPNQCVPCYDSRRQSTFAPKSSTVITMDNEPRCAKYTLHYQKLQNTNEATQNRENGNQKSFALKSCIVFICMCLLTLINVYFILRIRSMQVNLESALYELKETQKLIDIRQGLDISQGFGDSDEGIYKESNEVIHFEPEDDIVDLYGSYYDLDDDKQPEKIQLSAINTAKSRMKRSRNRKDDVRKTRQRDSRRHRSSTKKRKSSEKTMTSAIVLESSTATHCDGGMFYDWAQADLGGHQHSEGFEYDDGQVTVERTGVYFVYSQVTYYTKYPTVSFSVKKQSIAEGEDGEQVAPETLIKCINAVEISDAANDTAQRHVQCYVAKTVHLFFGDSLYIEENYTHMHNGTSSSQVEFNKDTTFWGIIRLR